MLTYDVWHQWCPVKAVEGGLYEPAVFHRGQVQAKDGAGAIEEAKRLRMSPAPMVSPA